MKIGLILDFVGLSYAEMDVCSTGKLVYNKLQLPSAMVTLTLC